MRELPQTYDPSYPVDSLTPHPRNPNKGNRQAIGESIETNGWYGACIVQQSSGHIIAGEHRWLEAREAGAETLPVLVLDVTDDEAVRIMLVDNRTARLGTDDPEELSRLLAELNADAGLLGTAYTPDDLDDLLYELARADGAGGLTPTERHDDYESRAIWTIVLPYPAAEHAALVAKLADLRAAYGLASNAEVVARLVNEAQP